MAKVYLVTTDPMSYSGAPCVEAVYSTREAAEGYLAAIDDSDCGDGIEEWELDSPDYKKGLAYTVRLLRNGDVNRARLGPRREPSPPVLKVESWHCPPEFRTYPTQRRRLIVYLEATVLAKSQADAIKIVKKDHAKMIAGGAWPVGVESRYDEVEDGTET